MGNKILKKEKERERPGRQTRWHEGNSGAKGRFSSINADRRSHWGWLKGQVSGHQGSSKSPPSKQSWVGGKGMTKPPQPGTMGKQLWEPSGKARLKCCTQCPPRSRPLPSDPRTLDTVLGFAVTVGAGPHYFSWILVKASRLASLVSPRNPLPGLPLSSFSPRAHLII